MIDFHGRRAILIENEQIGVTVTMEGGHIAEILDKRSRINPLWIPPWRSIEPSSYAAALHPEYGGNSESKLLAGIMGHNLCLGIFGPPSSEEAAAGLTVHGEASVLPYKFSQNSGILVARCALPLAQLNFERRIRLDGRRVLIKETVENQAAVDQPLAWTQHVTLGPPFLEKGATQFRVPATRSRIMGTETDFEWPWLPLSGQAEEDMQVYTSAEASGGFTTHLLKPKGERAWFFAYSPKSSVLFAYVWKRDDFPWIGIWQENHSRNATPWNGRTLTQGMEFGASPFAETRRAMIERGSLFATPGFRWLPAKASLTVDYYAAIGTAPCIPETLEQFEKVIS